MQTQQQQNLEKPEDRLIQYLSQIVIPRLRRADELYMAGMPLQAVRALKSLIRSLYHTEQTKDLVMSNWFSRIEAVESIVGGGSASIYRSYDTQWKRNAAASKVFEDLEYEIWGALHSLEYFKPFGLGRMPFIPASQMPIANQPPEITHFKPRLPSDLDES